VIDLGGRVAVVTGAAGGIGRALAEQLVARDMSVVLADVDEGGLATATSALADGGARVHAVPTDVADAASVEALADATVSKFGAVHVICNNAGVSGTFSRTWVAPPEDWKWVFDVNLWGVVNGIRSFVPRIIDAGEGHVLNTGSAACFEALPGLGPYAASKHAVLGISEALRRELIAAGVKVGVSVLIPGGIVKTAIFGAEQNWPTDRLGAAPQRDTDALPTLVRDAFRQAAVTEGVDPSVTASAAVAGILDDTFLISDDPTSLAQWGEHHAAVARGESPAWPPT
jgi:NAD(P)-dependent dehydrogenase (short-subunit alcohol dehydrogenase family)